MSRVVTAQPLVSNTYQPFVSIIANIYSGQWIATPFLTGPDPARLDSIKLYEWTLSGPPDGSFFVTVYGDSHGLPGSSLLGGGLNGPSAPQGHAYQTYSANQSLFLAPNTLYWVVASSDSRSIFDTYGWAPAANTGYTSSVGWSLFDYLASSQDQGASWHLSSSGNQLGGRLLEVDGAVVPEPPTLVLLMLGVTGWCFLRDRAPGTSAHRSHRRRRVPLLACPQCIGVFTPVS
jgi:hypothetical protein